MKIECPNCKNMCNINEHVKYCSKCGWVFIEYMNLQYKDLDDLGQRRSLENVDQD
jgi:hypothetical protein